SVFAAPLIINGAWERIQSSMISGAERYSGSFSDASGLDNKDLLVYSVEPEINLSGLINKIDFGGGNNNLNFFALIVCAAQSVIFFGVNFLYLAALLRRNPMQLMQRR
ncbi:MAG: hypothetical protein FWE82_04080, partial [Defluviitaleaceae bacterium]|nr:hypothetical protein [Defluviitaleaceae bacterium]